MTFDTHGLFRSAIEFNHQRSQSAAALEFLKVHGPMHFLRDFATVSINLGRQLGHTTYIMQNATPNDLVVVMRGYMLDEWPRHLRVKTMRSVCQGNTLRGHSIDRVWLDTGSFIFENDAQIAAFYDAVAPCNPSQIIMLG